MLLLIIVKVFLWSVEPAAVTSDLQASSILLYNNNNTFLAYS